MKILVLNPHFDPDHSALQALQKRGFAILHPVDVSEAWQMLQIHGVSVNLAVIHRENASGTGQPGIDLISKIKNDPAQADLPYILTTEKWGDAECAENQETTEGANAYLKFPFADAELVQLIDVVMEGSDLVISTPQVAVALAPPPAASPFALEDSTTIFQVAQTQAGSFTLEAPLSDDFPKAVSDPALSLDISADVSGPEFKVSAFDPSALEAAAPEVSSLVISSKTETESASDSDAQVSVEMPYLLNSLGSPSASSGASTALSPLLFTQPVGDAVVPGGAVHSPDLDTLKKYLLLREQDVAALSGQLRNSREQVHGIEDSLRVERAKNVELGHVYEEQKKKIEQFGREKSLAEEAAQSELTELRFQMKARTDKARLLEAQVREAAEEMLRLKERVRTDIRKIRVREKDLENRLEIMKKDSEALLGARENKIIELKRKLDLLEFNMDLLQDQYSREKQNSGSLRERLLKAAQVVRVAGGLLGTSMSPSGCADEPLTAAELAARKQDDEQAAS